MENIPKLEREKRLVLRTIRQTQESVWEGLANPPSKEIVHSIATLIQSWGEDLHALKTIEEKILDQMDFADKSQSQIDEAENTTMEEYCKQREKLLTARSKFAAVIDEINHPQETRQSQKNSLYNSVTSQNAILKLPDIPIPRFDGNIQNYTEWHALFLAMIDSNETLKPIQKLYYLKRAMVDDAKNLLRDFPLEENMYENAFKFVQNRYFNRRAIIAHQFHQLINLPYITNINLRELLDRIDASVRGLKVCQLEVDKMSTFLAYIIVNKFV